MKHRCPICKKIIESLPEKQSDEASFFPFCSKRCKLVDLGAWLDDKYRICSKLPDIHEGTPSDK